MTLLVTGATGEIGASILERLPECGEIRVLSRRARTDADGPIRWVEGDLLDAPSLSRACEGVERVLHMAALTHARRPTDYFRVNVEGTANLVRAAREAGTRRFVFVSTRAIGADGGPYSHSKQLAEEEVCRSGLEWIVLRPAEVYGGTGSDPILSMARSLQTKAVVPVLGSGSYELSPVHVEDVISAIVCALEHPDAVGNTYVLAGPETMSYLELVARMESVLGIAPRRRIHVPVALARLTIRAASFLGLGDYVPDQVPRLLLTKLSDSSAAARDLDFSPRSLEQGLRMAVGASAANG